MPWIIGFEFSTALIGFVLFVVYMQRLFFLLLLILIA